jgi:hypothetical protein
MIALLVVGAALADTPCASFSTPADVVESAMRVQGAAAAGLDAEAERRALLTRLACVSDPLTPGDVAAVHVALSGSAPPSRPPPAPGDAREGPPHPANGVALVDGQAFAALRSGPAVVQAFDAEGQVVYTRWLDAAGVQAVRGGAALPTTPTIPRLPPVPLARNEVVRLIASGALVATSGVLFAVAAGAREDWYTYDPAPVSSTEELERLRIRANVAQGVGLACAGVGAAGLLSVAVRVQF